jgi:hypothetical protein
MAKGIREVKFKGEGAGKTFTAGNRRYFNVAISTLPGTSNLLRIAMQKVDAKGTVLADLGFTDLRLRPRQDPAERVHAEIAARISSAGADIAASSAAADYLQAEWGAGT